MVSIGYEWIRLVYEVVSGSYWELRVVTGIFE